ncbi:hypothetical protein BAUCODRAFT_124956 [Baudoinia panamericana UAMH 10762]|uniref:Signal peptidase subunit 3 n=1 Tax=Baudoinia panamericana (strain UAMH 10762) TaxID=717646 RepID=M2N5C1_BAUPA|nr:uncharacterized protein BAUCODRAFT_124956 [Baudoinia panamericana UAMH 10762]EMC94239.1 hypothetical protein BAUCODRAFT_124956 [Baudoinia panamericana UAMH 10762]
MHNTLTRAQNVFGYFTSVAFAVAAAIAVSIVLSAQAPTASLELHNVQVVKGRPHYYSTKREEFAHVKFDLDADLSSVFNWNTKQIFVYITASYPSSNPSSIPASESVIWDAIIPASNAPWHQNTYIHPPNANAKPEKKTKKPAKKAETGKRDNQKAYPAGAKPGVIKLEKGMPKYQITDVTGKIAERQNATLTLHWNVQPWVGLLVWDNRRTYGRWQGLKGGDASFDFPSLQGTQVKKEDLKTATGAERNRGSPA